MEQFIEQELKDLGLREDMKAYSIIYNEALHAAVCLSKKELIAYISEYKIALPHYLFL